MPGARGALPPILGAALAAVGRRPRIPGSLVVLVLPLASISYLVFRAPRLGADEAEIAWPFFLLGAANAALAVGAVLAFLYLLEARGRSDTTVARLREKEKDQLATILRLEDELHLLGAMREVGQILSDDVRFEKIWEKVLEVVQSLIHAEELTIFLREGDDEGPLAPKVHHRDRRSLFGAEIDPQKVDATGVEEAIETHSVHQVVEDDALVLFFPLAVDGRNIGVLKVGVPLRGDAGERVGRIDDCQTILTELLKHLSLAIKTPTLYEVAVLDQLTGLYTKRFFVQQISQHMKVSQRHGTPFTLVLVDVDKFKGVNDAYGHLTGDIILRGIAECLMETARETDTCYRYGGEEMCILLPETTLQEGSILAERIRTRVEGSTFRSAQGEALRVTSSFGVASYEEGLSEFTELVERADQALYRAKEGGRNQVWRWEGKGPVLEDPSPPAAKDRKKSVPRRPRKEKERV